MSYVYSTSCSLGKAYKSETCRSLKLGLEEDQKAVTRDEIETLVMVDHIWKEKGNNLPLLDKAKIIDREDFWELDVFEICT